MTARLEDTRGQGMYANSYFLLKGERCKRKHGRQVTEIVSASAHMCKFPSPLLLNTGRKQVGNKEYGTCFPLLKQRPPLPQVIPEGNSPTAVALEI